MKKIISLLVFALCLGACTKDLEEEKPTGDISGSVSDKTTGEPVATVNVTLSPGGKSTVTGSDGSFSFVDLDPGDYALNIRKEGYNPNSGNFTVTAGKQTQAHLLIERIPAIVTADRDSLDFGDKSGMSILSFSIVNRGYTDLTWEMAHDCKWIKEIKPANGVLKYGKTETIVVTIDRNLLNGGNNETVLVIRSTNGKSEIKIKAIGEIKELPVLNTLDATEISATTALLNGEITHSGTPAYTERGFVYHTSSTPTLEEGKHLGKVTATVNSDNKYSAKLDGLTMNQTYYVRAYAVNSEGTAYSSNEIHFTTAATLPQVTVSATTDVNVSTGSAVFHGTVVSTGDPAYTERGFVYGETSTPTIEDHKLVVSGNGTGDYSLNVSDLPLDKTFYVRAYATNVGGTTYSDSSVVCSTMAVLPKVTTETTTDADIGSGTATFHGTIVSAGDPAYTERGFVYSTTNEPTVNDNKVTANGTGITGSFSLYVSNLPTTTYYVRAYATNRGGTVYGTCDTISLPYVELSTAKLMVQKKDLGRGNRSTAISMCENSTVGGYTDWRLPTMDELMILYNNKNLIGGFTTSNNQQSYYWSDYYISFGSVSYRGLSFYDGSYVYSDFGSEKYNIRCVRSLPSSHTTNNSTINIRPGSSTRGLY